MSFSICVIKIVHNKNIVFLLRETENNFVLQVKYIIQNEKEEEDIGQNLNGYKKL